MIRRAGAGQKCTRHTTTSPGKPRTWGGNALEYKGFQHHSDRPYVVNSPRSAPELVPPSVTSFRLLSDDEREASIRQSLQHWNEGDDLWVFGYGSLIWRPEFDYTERRLALLRGYHRALCLWSRVNRGTPERPGLVFGLDAGGSCRGMAFRIPAQQVPDVMPALWRREMSTGAYHPRWMPCHTEDGPVSALAFVMNRCTEAYVRGLSLDQLADIVLGAHGRYGPCIDYVLETARALDNWNIRDRRLQMLVERLGRNG